MYLKKKPLYLAFAFIAICVNNLQAQTTSPYSLQDVTDKGKVSQRDNENLTLKSSTQDAMNFIRWYNADGAPLGYVGYGSNSSRWFYVDNYGNYPVRISPRLILGNSSDDGTSSIQADGLIKATGTYPGLMLHNGKRWDLSNTGNNLTLNETGIKSRLFIKEGGNVGINTTDPQSALQLGSYDANNTSSITIPGAYNFEVMKAGQEGNGNAAIEFVNHTSGTLSYGIKMGTNIDRFGAGLYITAASPVSSYASLSYPSSPALFVNSSNQVAIGSNNTAGYKLAVAGNVIAEKIKVKAQPWPDYVFEQDYKLPSLQELEAFIKRNKHLPDIPSAEEVAKNDLDLGHTQAAMLKKIEELTLYILQQNKQIDAQQKTMQQLEKRLKELEDKK